MYRFIHKIESATRLSMPLLQGVIADNSRRNRRTSMRQQRRSPSASDLKSTSAIRRGAKPPFPTGEFWRCGQHQLKQPFADL
jgi:hypothetical protein